MVTIGAEKIADPSSVLLNSLPGEAETDSAKIAVERQEMSVAARKKSDAMQKRPILSFPVGLVLLFERLSL